MKTIKNFMCHLVILSILLLGATTLRAESATTKPSRDKLMTFELNDEKLLDIVNKLAGLKEVNILLPSDQKKLGATSVTFHLGYKISVDKAWEMMLIMLDIAGYTIIIHGNNLYEIIASTGMGNSPAPLYINTKTELIKNSESTIRYLYYFQNINLKESGIKTDLEQILKDMITGQQPEQNFLVDDKHNSLLITNKANTIKSIINIIHELDQGGFREAIEVVPILHTSAGEIVDIINKLIPKKQDDETFRFPPLVAEPKNSKTYFSASTRIIPIEQTNSVAIFGLYESVQRIKGFIQKYLDKTIDAEKTVLHVKPLKYLDSVAFATTLTELIQQKGGDGSQSTGKPTDKILNGVMVQAEQTVVSKATQRKLDNADKIGVQLSTAGGDDSDSKGPFIGGNNLIVAATQRDWKIIDKLIDELDTPQWQVALEVLIVDMTISTNKALHTQLRRIANDNASHEFKWQSAQTQIPALDYTVNPPGSDTPFNSTRGVESDLMSTQPPESSSGSIYNIAASEAAGSTVFTFKDKNGVAAILSLLDSYSDVKVLSRPFVITKNNQQANILEQERKYVQGSADLKSMGGTPVINYDALDAAIKVSMTPRISRIADNINLEIRVDANEFVGDSIVITQRTVVTNANVGNQAVLVLGGITKVKVTDGMTGIPIISKIPLIGHFFKSQNMEYAQRNLVIFVCPTRIAPAQPNIATGPNQFTKDRVDDISNKFINYSAQFTCRQESENFQCLSDPITNFVFPYSGAGFAKDLQEYVNQSVWGKTMGEKKEKKYREDIEKFAGQPDTDTGKSETSKSDKLKTILANEKNPLKK